MNTNCLEGLACPKCGQAEMLKISAHCVVEVTDDGTGDAANFEWYDEDNASCPSCHYFGTLATFRTTSEAQ